MALGTRHRLRHGPKGGHKGDDERLSRSFDRVLGVWAEGGIVENPKQGIHLQ